MASNAATASQSLGEFRPASLSLATIGLSLGTFMQVLDMTIANVSLPTIAGNLGASQDQSTWVITSFTVAQAITLPMTGFLSRRFGEVKVFVWAVLLFSLFSLCCGLATSLSMLVLFRALQGAVCGPMYPITQSLMVSIYPREKRGMALAIIAMITVVAPIVGPVAGGWITDSYSWRWIFFINIPIGIFAGGVVAMQMGKRIEQLRRARIDWVGLITLILGVGSLQILLDKGNELDWFHSTTIITLAIVATIALAVWVIWELTDNEPLVDLRLFRHRNFAAGTLALVLAYALFFSIALLLPLWLQNVIGYTALWSGLAAAPVGVIPVLLTFWVGRYAHKFDMRWLTAFSFAVMGLVCLRFGSFNTDVDFWSVALTELMLGLGIALFFMPILTILLSDLEGQEIAEGSGSATFLRTVGASFAVSIVTYLWTRGGVVSHANLAAHINAFNAEVRQNVTAMGGQLQHYAAGINGVITQQGMQISFNQIMDGLAIGFFLLIAVVWLAKPPFVARGGGATGGH
ncbi:MAG: Multidrug efflux system EmrAB-OMF, inner-membrane proton/drug antiporter EmrB (MFS type) [Rhodanobacteraceae bacterium]|jgi:DHA2 family multidrug resistance protein|nr:MAG: Multidrug efflux system EmrAB-OMF, inner-membrane proton/drug antiporter EmrB (MFS type) [Rhodanobacteraceae bacterium]